MSASMYEHIRTIVPEERLLFHEPMSKHTTFRVGGEAECMIVVETKDELAQIISYLGRLEQDYFVLGNGSNLLVGDKGYRGVIVKMGKRMGGIRVEQNHIAVGASAPLSLVATVAKEKGLSGLEFAAGIPGTVGGAIVMNAGAYGGEMKQIVQMVRVMDKEGQILTLDNDTMEFGYRTSIIKDRPFIVLGVVLKLTPGNEEEIGAKMEELMKQRKSKQPLEYPSAGSTFKRPEGYYAGKLIMDAGLRGYRIGGAQVSEKHCGFVINAGGATAADIKEVIEEIQERVRDRFHVRLEPEVVFLGDF